MKRTMFVALAVAVMLMGVIAYATAATSASVTVNAKVNPKLELTIDKISHTLSGLPGDGPVSATSIVNVRSNVGYKLTRTGTGAIATAVGTAFSVTDISATPGSGTFLKAPTTAGFDHTQKFMLDLGTNATTWLDPADVTEVFTYSVVQN